ncbi:MULTISPECIES: hypothetical protein [Streptomyces]|uniref:Uncharacterized protein n=1 Tax=Streptomyces nojiriensis TaxID=66374 RepID=A0ABQ3SER8_9ACTN|nr:MULTISPECIES: hypothetical protein [Streptomyces]WTA18220.1 hypothetical protein OG365_09170 [Streptomyces sp. NBC_00853]MCX4806128.1 hypothetical protein [Streptomyces sp. NBC_01214]QTI48278.1 hypothetical protein JYK04_06138 [Streptomyces nojiriensis]WSR14308.1 hypothetical protein OG457_14270 [Streptomyces sp. NBC_01207]GGS26620.1 hypothetical protein GCM10010205_65960 [Streptomyces nojiriensis]
MFLRREPVPFAFVSEADRFRSNVTPPPRERLGRTQLIARTLVGLTVVAGLAGSLLLGMPALQPSKAPEKSQQSEASQGR